MLKWQLINTGPITLIITLKTSLNLIRDTRHDPHLLSYQIRRFKANPPKIPILAIALCVVKSVLPERGKNFTPPVLPEAKPRTIEEVPETDDPRPSKNNTDPHTKEV